MAKCKTDCIEKPISLIFEKFGRIVGNYPIVFFIVPLLVAAALGAGFMFLGEREANDIEDQFTPVNGPAKQEREIVLKYFPKSEEFSQLRLSSEGTYASLIITGLEGANIWTEAAFTDIIEIDRQVKNITTGNTYEILCAKTKGKCMSNAILDIINYSPGEIISTPIRYPMNNGTFLGTSVGGVDLKTGGSEISSAKAVRLFYFLKEENTTLNNLWLTGFLKFFSNYSELKTKTKVKEEVEDRLAETYKEAAVSITITTLTDVMSFYIGLLTPFGSVQSFCMYTSTAILFCYIFNITFFGACLALNGRREKGNKHWLTCMKVPEVDSVNATGNVCCVGGAYDEDTGTDEAMPMDLFFKNHYSPFLTKTWVKISVCLFYSGYLAVSIYGCLQLQEGLDLKHLATDGSYVGSYYDDEDQLFSSYGPNVMLVITDENFQYWNSDARQNLDLCLEHFQNLSMASKHSEILPISWLTAYIKFGQSPGIHLDNETQFKQHLPAFLRFSGFSEDVNFTNNKILASRMFIQTVNITTAVDEKNMLNAFRETAERCGKLQTAVNVMVYHPAFIYYDQYAVIVSNTIQNIAVATCVMLLISLLLIPNPLCSVWVTFAIASVIVGVTGFMALWDVSLDSVSMINLVICIGFSVDFSAHISYAFVASEELSVNEKAKEALYKLGYPIIQGAASTIAGVVVLAAAKSYIFRTFFKIMFLVILFGAVHGVVFIPVFLTFFGICDRKSRTKPDKDTPSEMQSEKSNRNPQQVSTVKSNGHTNERFTSPDSY
ncbi:Patched domain-containing protein 3 RND-type protein RNDEu-3 [Triplophysa tibetana]|uniref:Patched domain-containing protein 3 n=1 Tax=Triplophysa tibetana TaxID=1572043 RepID=A0A5A9N1L9_9TELE|nr:Patched domain-containing protein 3 RND-type protein RNDEu-3 [Triplophysa tibetana]